MTRLASIATLVVVTVCATTPARAGVADDLAQWLDADAAVVLRGEPGQIEHGVALAQRLGVPGIAEAQRISRLLGQSGLGADLLTRSGWHQAGFDTAAPIMAGLAAVNAPAVAKALASTRKGRPVAAPIWRSRIVLRMRDPGRVGSLVKRVARLAPMLSGVSTVETPLIARLLGATVMQSMRLAGDLSRRGVIAVGYFAPTQSLVFVMKRGNTLVVDVLGTFDGQRPRWKHMGRRLLSVLDRGRGRFDRRMSRGAAVELRKRGSTLWIDAVSFYDAVEAQRNATLLSLLLQRTPPPHGFAVPRRACADFRKVAKAGPFRDVAVRTLVTPKRVTSEWTWGMRYLFKMSAPFLALNDQLPVPKVTANGPVAVGALFVRGLGHLRSVPRPKVLQSSFLQMWSDAALCGFGATTTVAMYGWPQVLGLFLDDLAKVHPDANTLVTGLRNGVFSLRKLAWRLQGLDGVVAVTGTKAAMPVARRMLATVFGPAANHRTNSGATATWGAGPMRPFAFQTKLGHPALGIAHPPAGITRYLRAKPVPLQSKRALIGTLRVDLTRALPQLLGATGSALAATFTRSSSYLEVTPETIVLSTRLTVAAKSP